MVIIINGAAGSGKDAFVKNFTKASRCAVQNFSTVDDVKTLAKCMGWDGGKKHEEDRRFLSDLKDIWTRYNNGPFESVKMRILLGRILHNSECVRKKETGIIFFVHCREPEEIEKFKKEYGRRCRTLLIRRNGIKRFDNHADKNVENFDYDIVVENHRGMSALAGRTVALARGLDAEAEAFSELDRKLSRERSRNIWPENGE